MPKDLFFNLPEAKRQMFLEVAISEFSSKPFDQVSVNSIIKRANIARGSFYLYFENLDELFLYLFESVKKERFANVSKFIQESQGDIFLFIEKLFAYDYASYTYKETYSLFRNYVYYFRFRKHSSIKKEVIMPLISMIETKMPITKAFHLSSYRITLDEFLDILETIMILNLDLFVVSETNNLSKDEVFRIFHLRLDVIKKGVL